MGYIEKIVYGKKSYVISNKNIELSITKQGGHMAPVVFYRDTGNPVIPYFISPWQSETEEPQEPNLKPLRGDFFCMPCGLPNAFRDEGFMVHGETASENWYFEDILEENDSTQLILRMDTKLRKGTVRKIIKLIEKSNVIYLTHELSGFEGSFSLGHHATLKIPEKTGSVLISTSPVKFGYTQPRNEFKFENNGEYYFLQSSRKFYSIKSVPTIWKDKPYINCSEHPLTDGFMGLIQLYNEESIKPAWVAAYYPDSNFVWFALKNPSVLTTTVLWMENRGRHAEPWSGRTRCLGVEDNCVAIGDDDLNAELRSDLDNNGIRYNHILDKNHKMTINYIEGVQKVPSEFGEVKNIIFNDCEISLISQTGREISITVDWEYLYR